jgi:cysteinyl-tRNA synthetase, unknown class
MSVLRNASTAIAAGLLAVAVLLAPAGAADRANPFQGAKTWGYQLRNLDPGPRKSIADSQYDLVVTDYARGESRNEIPLTRAEVAEMQKRPDGSKRLVIAYLSIGETENYRYYWKPQWDKKRPAWMGKENKEWKANYLAKYWDPEWQKIIYGSPEAYVDRVLSAGFDGFYFDRVDAYYAFGDNAESRGRMVRFIVDIAKYARSKKPDVAIMVQNAEELLDSKDYLDAIDGIAKESLLFGIRGLDKPNLKTDVDETTDLMRKANGLGKSIFVVEYLKDKNNIAIADQRINKELGWALYVGTRGLAQLGRTPLEPAPPLDDEDAIGAEKTKPQKAAKEKRAAVN